MFISHKGHTDTIQVYSVTVMTHVKALQAGHSSQGTSEPITPVSGVVSYNCNSIPFCYQSVLVYFPCLIKFVLCYSFDLPFFYLITVASMFPVCYSHLLITSKTLSNIIK